MQVQKCVHFSSWLAKDTVDLFYMFSYLKVCFMCASHVLAIGYLNLFLFSSHVTVICRLKVLFCFTFTSHVSAIGYLKHWWFVSHGRFCQECLVKDLVYI